MNQKNLIISKHFFMTAVVGILNKQAVTIAADSAVTIGGLNGRKIFNRANKVFTLSKHHPIGIMIYNSASLMLTPWETIIKIYRKQLGKNSFATVKEYQENFIQFLKNKNFYSNITEQKSFLNNFLSTLISNIVKEVASANKHLVSQPIDENKAKVLLLIEQKVDLYLKSLIDQGNYCDDFINYSFNDFEKFTKEIIDEIIKQEFTINGYMLSENLLYQLKQLCYQYLKTKENQTNSTGLIFTGFGEEEIYPALIPVNVSFAVEDRLRFYVEDNKSATITNDNNGAICPFAQTDVIDTILTGIDPRLDDIYLKNFEEFFTKYNHEILNLIGDGNPEASAQIKELNITQILSEYSKKNLETKQTNYIFPLMNAISSLSKEDLAEMAESLIYLTYLERRITFAEESVGGPVDVAIISKGDGFIWIKRKHYFKPELNQYFFDNYLNN